MLFLEEITTVANSTGLSKAIGINCMPSSACTKGAPCAGPGSPTPLWSWCHVPWQDQGNRALWASCSGYFISHPEYKMYLVSGDTLKQKTLLLPK